MKKGWEFFLSVILSVAGPWPSFSYDCRLIPRSKLRPPPMTLEFTSDPSLTFDPITGSNLDGPLILIVSLSVHIDP